MQLKRYFCQAFFVNCWVRASLGSYNLSYLSSFYSWIRGQLNAEHVNVMLVAFGPFIHVEKIDFDSFIPKICRIVYNYSFLCCLPYCFEAIISIWMIATAHKSLILAGFLQQVL